MILKFQLQNNNEIHECIQHFSGEETLICNTNLFVVQQYWTRIDFEPANRENLMMALADLDYIIIRATYNSVASVAA